MFLSKFMKDKHSQQLKSYNRYMRTYATHITLSEYQKLPFNKVSEQDLKRSLIRSGLRINQSDSYICGMHALNIVSLTLSYKKQWSIKNYLYKGFWFMKWGLSGYEFAQKLIYPFFNSYFVYCGQQMPDEILAQTDYQNNCVIVLVGTSHSIFGFLHYIVVIGKSQDAKQYVVIDASQQLFKISNVQLELLMRTSTPTVAKYNLYRIGK